MGKMGGKKVNNGISKKKYNKQGDKGFGSKEIENQEGEDKF